MLKMGRRLKPSPYESAYRAKEEILLNLKSVNFIVRTGLTEKDVEELKTGLRKALEELERSNKSKELVLF